MHVLTGLGGTGKTQLAAELAREQLKRRKVDLLVWVTATDVDAIVAGYAEAAAAVGLVGRDHDQLRAASAFLSWLQTTDRRWLVVFDDLTRPGDLKSWWPPATSRGRVLVTTRRRDSALSGQGRTVAEVGLFTPQEAQEYLLRALSGNQSTAELEQLANDLGHLPLALSQAAAYMRDRGLDCAEYRARLADRRRRLTELLPEYDALPDDQQAGLAATWSLSVDLADHLAPQGLARPVLAVTCLLDPSGIPTGLFTAPAMLTYLNAATGQEASGDDARDAIRNLHRLHLLTLDTDQGIDGTGQGKIRVHAMVQRATRDQLTDITIRHAARATATALLQIWPEPELDVALGSALRSNTAALHHHAPTALLTPETHRVLFRAGESLGETGQVTATVAYFQRLLSQSLQELGPDHPRTLAAKHSLGHWRGHAGDAKGALAEFRALLADRQRVLGADHPDTLRARGAVADWRGHTGDTAGAFAEFRKLVSDRQRLLGPDHQDTLFSRGNAARWQGQTGDAAGAVTELSALIPDLTRVLGPDHPDTLRARNNLAHFQGETGDPTGAATTFKTLVNDRARILGPDHPDTLRARNNHAYWMMKQGAVPEAVTELAALIPDLSRVLGPDHPSTLRARNNLAHLRGGEPNSSHTDALDALIPELARTGGLDPANSAASEKPTASA